MTSQQSCQLPVELWAEVFQNLLRAGHPSNEGYLIPRDDSLPALLSLALVCQRFRHLLQSFIFSRFHFDYSSCPARDYEHKLVVVAGKIEQLLVVLEQKPGYSCWIKDIHCHFLIGIHFGHGRRGPSSQITRVQQLVERLLLQLTDVKSLILSGMNIPRDLYEHIYRVPTLQIVHLKGLTQPTSPSHPESHTKWQELPLRELTITTIHPMHAVDTTALFRLSLGSRLKSLNIPLWMLARNYQQDASISWASVTDLTLSVFEADDGSDQLGSVLTAFPSLLRLYFPPVSEIIQFGELQQECVPVLTDFCGPWRLACSIIPGRPIQKASIQLADDIELSRAEIEVLSQSTAKLEHLELRGIWEFHEHLKQIATLLPDLEFLSLGYRYESVKRCLIVLTDFVSSNCTMPQLKQLRCSIFPPGPPSADDEEISEWLRNSATAFPVLRTVEIQRHFWRRDPGEVGSGYIRDYDN